MGRERREPLQIRTQFVRGLEVAYTAGSQAHREESTVPPRVSERRGWVRGKPEPEEQPRWQPPRALCHPRTPACSSSHTECCLLWSRLAVQVEENEMLKAALGSALRGKEEDFRMYHEILGQVKSVFLQALRQQKTDKQ